jgi:exopolyphosphatase/guanosine-5'-triphosphate,3'-diphosphate pyrophosphatase
MLVAVIDLGTNTFNLLIAEVNSRKGTFGKKFKDRISVKLGEGGINKGYIAEEPFQRGIEAIKEYRLIVDNHQVKEVFAFATSAVRSASNGVEFIEEVLRQTGIKVQTISGDREAELIYYGTRMAVKFGMSPVLIMDIGGGSTEFIIADEKKIYWKQSFLLGAARLLEKFRPEDPIKGDTIDVIRNYFREELRPLYIQMEKHPLKKLVGSSGAFDSFVDMLGWKFGTAMLKSGATEYTIDLKDYTEMSNVIIRSTMEERGQIKGLIPMRKDMIVISMLFVDFIIKEFKIEQLVVSTYSLKEGVIGEMMKRNNE